MMRLVVRRRRKHRRRLSLYGRLGTGLLYVLAGCIAGIIQSDHVPRTRMAIVPAAADSAPDQSLYAYRSGRRHDSQPERLVYPHSVISGGVHSDQELALAEWTDPVVREHYSDFNLKKFRVVLLPAEKKVYVSYRIKDAVFWTRKKIRLAQYEPLITDGVHYARARCGNRISVSEMAPEKISLLELPAAELEAMLPAPVSLPLLTSATKGELEYLSPKPPAASEQTVPTPSGPGVPIVFVGGTPTGPRPISPVPEPSELWLISSAVGAFALYRARFKKRHLQRVEKVSPN
jgi:hypothetical protein